MLGLDELGVDANDEGDVRLDGEVEDCIGFMFITGVVANEALDEPTRVTFDDNGEMFSLSRLNSNKKRRLTKLNRDWANTPITSAYRSVTYWLSEYN